MILEHVGMALEGIGLKNSDTARSRVHALPALGFCCLGKSYEQVPSVLRADERHDNGLGAVRLH